MKWIVALLALANLALLLPPASAGRVAGALLLLGFLPGLTWARRWLPDISPLLRWTIAAALSYTFTSLAALLLHYLPGPIYTWQFLLVLNLLALLPLLGWNHKTFSEQALTPSLRDSPSPLSASGGGQGVRAYSPLMLILALALLLRFVNLGYSEFQGDESLVMITAAEALTGHEDALWLRSKGPAEVLLPLALWQLSGTITELIARLPFTVASLWAIVTVYLIGWRLGGPAVGWLAAGFFAFNGFTVAFGRIVQYQALVLWFSSLAWLLAAEWALSGQKRLAWLAGLSLGLGLLAHYDALLALPAIAWLLLAGLPGPGRPFKAARLAQPALLFGLALLLVALPFYLPFLLDPQANHTGDYIGQRIGTELRNNLPDFFHFNTFYSSAYYIIVTGLLVLGLLAVAIWRAFGRSIWPPVVAVAAVLAVVFAPNLLAVAGLNLALLPFALALLAAMLAYNRRCSGGRLWQALLAWLAVPFLGYNFVVALGLTHIYTIVPAWSLLAGLAWFHLFYHPQTTPAADTPAPRAFGGVLTTLSGYRLIASALPLLLLVLSTVFLWNAFIRHDVEYWQDYPAGNLAWYWTPYDQPPRAGLFGFAHRTGWKAVGQKISSGELSGDYGSNEEPDVTTWYTRGAPRACDPRPEFYFLASDLIDPVEVPGDLIAAAYEQIGQVTLPNQKQLTIMQQRPVTYQLSELPEQLLADQFDLTATPAAFARSVRGALPAEANFGRLVRLIGYHLDTRRAYPSGRVPVTLYWQALAPIPASYHVFAHLEGAAGPAAQADGVPVCWSYPTDRWRPGQIIADQHAIPIPPDMTPGLYPLQVGLYLAENFTRLDVLDEAGNPAGVSVTLAQVEIRE